MKYFNFSQLVNTIKGDQIWFKSHSFKQRFKMFLVDDHLWEITLYMFFLRLSGFYRERNRKFFLLYLLFERTKNRLGNKLGFYIEDQSLCGDLTIFHIGSVVINPGAILGDKCKLHGNNCIGNDGKSNDCPVIGDNVDIGFGASIIGKVTVGDNSVIGAGALVISDLPSNCVAVGVPAKVIKFINEEIN